jgi:predicted membrane chloride channel (bestrophin family)
MMDHLAVLISIMFNAVSSVGVVVAIFFNFRNQHRIDTIKVLVNGRVDDLLETTRKLARAEAEMDAQKNGKSP